MSEIQALPVDIMEKSGKSEARKVRARGMVPSVLYGKGVDQNVNIACNRQEIKRILSKEGHNALFQLQVERGTLPVSHVMIKDIQYHPLSLDILHIDFYAVNLKEKIVVEIPLKFVGIATGVVNDGGILEPIHREVKVKCLPGQAPDHIEVDVSQLSIGDTIRVADLNLSKEFEAVYDENFALVTVAPPAKEEVVAPPVAAAVPAEEAAAEGEAAEGAEKKEPAKKEPAPKESKGEKGEK
ncbi:MAG: 50S ribosomal protein L25 [Deltaproteobacteria bacterium]|nr:50S ribosomal protein L25 [Deltaproteobacteria bacterium]